MILDYIRIDCFHFGDQPANQGALAANTSDIRLRNPATSGIIAVVSSILYNNTNAAAQIVNFTNGSASGDLTTPLAMGRGLDARSGRPPSLLLSKQNNGAALTGSFAALNISTPGNFEIIGADSWNFIPILPGDAIQVGNGTVNSVTQVNFRWMERPLEDSEKKS